MEHSEMVTLIRDIAPEPGGVWADLGAGGGNFTRALAELLGPAATIYAVDRAPGLRRSVPAGSSAAIAWRQADFTQPMSLPTLDGLLLANALHFNPDQAVLLAQLGGYLRVGGRLALVEYDLDAPLAFVPYPVSFRRFGDLAARGSFPAPQQVGRRISPSSGIAMYAAFTTKRDVP